jgi:SAM-dependent methyltransferase
MATDMKLDPAPIMQISTGPWANAILAAAVEHRVFVHLEGGPLPADALATKAGISPRGAQALLDGLLGLSLAEKEGDRYRNSALASAFLVDGKPTFLGGLSRVNLAEGPRRALLPQAVRTGVPAVDETTDLKENPFWELLVPAIAGLAAPVAQLAAEKLGVARAGAISVLDVGGGSGIYAIVWGRINPQCRFTQLDWGNVNRIARDITGKAGIADRFETIDDDFHTADFGSARYDFAIYSNIAHQESPRDNTAVFRKFRKALKPGGALVISDFVLENDRTGHPFALMFHSTMLLDSKEGAVWRKADYEAWLREAGFSSVTFEPSPGPSTIVIAR